MLEKDVRLAPRLFLDAPCPVVDRILQVFSATQAEVTPRGGGNHDGVRIGDFVGVGQAEWHIALPQNRVDLFVAPRIVTELECHLRLRREDAEELAQLQCIFARERRKLKENWPELRAERRRDIEQLSHIVFCPSELLLMCYALRSLEHEREAIGNLLRPFREHLLVRHTVERVVDFDGVEALRIELQHLRRRQIVGIETPLPFFVAVAAGADADAHGVTIIAPCANSCWRSCCAPRRKRRNTSARSSFRTPASPKRSRRFCAVCSCCTTLRIRRRNRHSSKRKRSIRNLPSLTGARR